MPNTCSPVCCPACRRNRAGRQPGRAPGRDAARLEQLVGGVWLQNVGAVLLLLGVFLMILWGYGTGRVGPGVLVLETSWLGFQSEDELMRVQCFGDTSGLIWPEGVLVGETDRVPWTIRLDKSDERSGFDEQMLRFATAVRDGLASPVPVEQTRTVIRILARPA